ncbi:hypothetical protein SDJN02_17347, partial [Cucurbita argyrosperma subsp. argyrosperma]
MNHNQLRLIRSTVNWKPRGEFLLKRLEGTNQSRFLRSGEERSREGGPRRSRRGIRRFREERFPFRCGCRERFRFVFFTKLSTTNCDYYCLSPVSTPLNHELSLIVPVDVSCRHSRRRSACEFAQILSGYSQAALSVC